MNKLLVFFDDDSKLLKKHIIILLKKWICKKIKRLNYINEYTIDENKKIKKNHQKWLIIYFENTKKEEITKYLNDNNFEIFNIS